ncbi:RsmE family RNA methyltransferase, partial [Oleiphilus sp. HI0123]
MRIPNIYVDQPLEASSNTVIEGQAAQHLLKVLRMKAGDQLRLFNGDGKFYPATIQETSKKSFATSIGIAENAVSESKLKTHIG